MASVYTNDLRLEEIGSGEQSGTWGDTTNTNLELIAEGFSFGTEAITTNADTHTSTVADGATDPARSMYIKYTGTLDSTCTITIAPNTLSRMHFIENGTSGSQDIIISQGSGANVTIPPGDVKAVYLDGAGSGAAVVDAFASLNVGAFTSNGASTITVADNSTNLSLVSTDADASVGPVLDLYRNSASPADNDRIGSVSFRGRNDNSQDVDYAVFDVFATDVSDGSEDVEFDIRTIKGGTETSSVTFLGTETVFNQASTDLDFRIESNGNANMLFVDGGNDAVVVGHSTGIAISGEHNELQVYDTNFSVASFATFRNGSDGATLNLAHSRSGTIGTQTVLNDADIMGAINFIGSDGTDMATSGAAIRGVVDGTPGSNDMPGRLVFLTTPDGSATTQESMRIDSSGGVSIGSDANAIGIHSLAKVLEISGGDGGDLIIGNNVSTNIGAGAHVGAIAFKNIDSSTGSVPHYAGIRSESEDTSGNMDLRFYTGTANLEADTPQVTIDSGGTVMLGEINEITNGADLNVTMVSEDTGIAISCRSATDGHTPYLHFQKTPATSGNYTATASGDFLGLIQFNGVNTSGSSDSGGRIQVKQTGTASGTVPAEMQFITNEVQRVSITSGGSLTTGDSGNADISGTDTGGLAINANGGFQMIDSRTTDTGNTFRLRFFNGTADAAKGSITTDGDATAFNTSSDYRLKENVDYDWDATTRLKQLKPARFNWITDDTNTLVDGFLAHEAATVVPNAVVGEKDATEQWLKCVLNAAGDTVAKGIEEADWTAGKSATTDADGNTVAAKYASDTTWVATKDVPMMQSIDHSFMVPLLVKTIQELEARITALEA